MSMKEIGKDMLRKILRLTFEENENSEVTYYGAIVGLSDWKSMRLVNSEWEKVAGEFVDARFQKFMYICMLTENEEGFKFFLGFESIPLDFEVSDEGGYGYYNPLEEACRLGWEEIVETILQRRVDQIGKYSIYNAASGGYTSIVKRLLDFPRTESLDTSLMTASQNGHTEIVRLLLEAGVEPSSWSLNQACIQDHLDVVKLLAEKMDPSMESNCALTSACELGNYKMVEYLLTFPQIDPSNFNNYPLLVSCHIGWPDIVRLLLKDSRVNPADRDSLCLILAATGGNYGDVPGVSQRKVEVTEKHEEIVEILIEDGRVNLKAQDDLAMRGAVHLHLGRIIEILKQNR